MKDKPRIIEALSQIVGREQVLTEKEDVLPFGFDGTAALKKAAECVVFPGTVEEAAAVVRFCSENDLAIVTRGSGTGLSGGSLPVEEGIIVCLLRLNKILEVDADNLTLLAECGVITQKIAEAAAEKGLFYPPDPGSMKISTIGGNVAENSGGLRGLKYGVTRNYVMGMEVILPDGTVTFLGNKCVKDVAGFSMKDVFIGSEGTLGLITKVLLRLVPPPPARQTMLGIYPKMEDAARTVSEIIARKIIPCTLEFLDQVTIQCIEDYAKIGLPTDAGAILLMESDGAASVVETEAAAMAEIARKNGATEVRVAQSAEESNELAAARRTAFSALARVRPTTILEDATVPRSELTKMVKFIQEIGEKYQLRIGTFGHMGDGNLHPTFLTDEKNEEEMEKVEKAMKEIFTFAISLGGTITGEHGVGVAKKDFLPEQYGADGIRLFQSFKKAIDPKGLLNPGKLVDVERKSRSA